MTTEKIAEFKVGNIIYDVQLDSKIMATEQALGLCDYVNATISLYPNQNEQRMEQVMFHELTHAIFAESGYDEQDEDMVNRLGIVMHQFITDNFEFVGHSGIRADIEAAQSASASDAKPHAHPVGFNMDTPPQTETEQVEDFDDEVPGIDGGAKL